VRVCVALVLGLEGVRLRAGVVVMLWLVGGRHFELVVVVRFVDLDIMRDVV
jgi:hypothetical protein